MLANIPKLTAAIAAIGSAAYAANMFMATPGNPGAGLAVMLVGIAIFLFTLLLSLGALVAGIWRAVLKWRKEHAHAGRGRLEAN